LVYCIVVNIFAAITLKFGLSFCSKELQFQFAFQIDWFIILY
jgi:hypothetical protein